MVTPAEGDLAIQEFGIDALVMQSHEVRLEVLEGSTQSPEAFGIEGQDGHRPDRSQQRISVMSFAPTLVVDGNLQTAVHGMEVVVQGASRRPEPGLLTAEASTGGERPVDQIVESGSQVAHLALWA